MPEFGNLLTYMQDAGASILIIILIGWVIVYGVKREIGKAVGGIVLLAIFVVIVKNPDQTIIQFAQELVNRLLPST